MSTLSSDWSSSFDWGSFVFRPDASDADYERDPLRRFFSEEVDEERHLYDVDQLQALLANCPHNQRQTDGNFPLHTAWLAPSSSMSVPTMESLLLCIQSLIRSFPDAAKEKNQRGLLPLHLALQRDHLWCRAATMAMPVLQTLLEAHMEALGTKTNIGELPLHLSLKNREGHRSDSSVVLKLMESYPQALKEFSSHGHTPLQMLILRPNWGSDDDVLMKSMVQLWEDALWTPSRTPTVYLPLHLACHRCHVSCIQFLLRAYPQASRVLTVGAKGNLLPLNMAWLQFGARRQTNLSNVTSWRLVTSLLGKEYPQAFYHRPDTPRSSSGMIGGSVSSFDFRLIDSLSVFRSMFGSLDAFVTEIFGEAAATAAYPLHEACREGAPMEIIHSMIRVFDPLCLQQKDDHGCLPLHYAAASNSVGTVESLVEANGAALSVTCSPSEERGCCRPFEYGALMRRTDDQNNMEKNAFTVLYLLLRSYPDVVLDYSWNE